MAITRPLGEVSLAAMNRCAGIYRVYLNGGGGGGGGFDDFYEWYGGAGGNAAETLYTGSLVPPISITTLGTGGSAGIGMDGEGGPGGQTSMGDSRATFISALGGDGGTSATTEKSLYWVTAITRFAKETSRFDLSFSNAAPSTPYFLVEAGRGGDSLTRGSQGGIIKAFRIG